MKKNKNLFRTALVLLIILLLFILYYYAVYDEEKEETKVISVIVYGNSSERWENLRRGAEQAADTLSAEINLVTLSKDHDVEEQKELIQREINNGADALMIAACDSEAMKQATAEIKIPIMFIESGIGDDTSKSYISADNYAMGQALGAAVTEQEIDKVKVAVICDNMQRDSVALRYEGFCDALDGKIDRLVDWEKNQNETDIAAMLFLQRELTEEAVDVVVALDNSSTGAIIDAVENLDKDVKIYGIANTDKAVYYLDNGMIETLVYQNEFSIGYLGVQELLGEVNYGADEIKERMEFRAVSKEDMYSVRNQEMLFPFVK